MTFSADNPWRSAAENALLATIPEERRDDIRALLIAARQRDAHQLVLAEQMDDHAPPAGPDHAPLPVTTRDESERFADQIMRAALRPHDPYPRPTPSQPPFTPPFADASDWNAPRFPDQGQREAWRRRAVDSPRRGG